MEYFSNIQTKMKKTIERLMLFTYRPSRGKKISVLWPTVPAGNN